MQTMEQGAKPTRNSIECWIAKPACDGWDVLLLRVVPVEGAPEGFWQSVTGGIEVGETPAEACLREVFEETGFVVSPDRLRQVRDGLIVEIPDMFIRKTLFLATLAAPVGAGLSVTTDPREHTDYRWVPAAEVPQWLYWDSNHLTWGLVSKLLTFA